MLNMDVYFRYFFLRTNGDRCLTTIPCKLTKSSEWAYAKSQPPMRPSAIYSMVATHQREGPACCVHQEVPFCSVVKMRGKLFPDGVVKISPKANSYTLKVYKASEYVIKFREAIKPTPTNNACESWKSIAQRTWNPLIKERRRVGRWAAVAFGLVAHGKATENPK